MIIPIGLPLAGTRSWFRVRKWTMLAKVRQRRDTPRPRGRFPERIVSTYLDPAVFRPPTSHTSTVAFSASIRPLSLKKSHPYCTQPVTTAYRRSASQTQQNPAIGAFIAL